MVVRLYKGYQKTYFQTVFFSKHNSNEHESIKLIKEVIIPYMEDKRKSESLPADQMGLAIMDVFTGQMTSAVKDLLDSNYIGISNIPPSMTKYYQPLYLTVNGVWKRFLLT